MYGCSVSAPHSHRFLAVRDHRPATLFYVSSHRVFGRPVLLLPILTLAYTKSSACV